MAPEQAKGRPADKRSDIWAFGCVLYEMLTAQRAFTGDNISEILASLLRDTPSLDRLPPATPAHVRALLGRCLDRDPRTRLRDIGEARVALSGNSHVEAGAPVRPASRWRTWAAAAAGVVIGALVVALVVLVSGRRAPRHLAALRMLPITVDGLDLTLDKTPVISPDGRRIVYSANGSLWLRDLSRVDAQALPDTEGAAGIFWSPDSTRIGFIRGGRLWAVPTGGRATSIAVLPHRRPSVFLQGQRAVGSRGTIRRHAVVRPRQAAVRGGRHSRLAHALWLRRGRRRAFPDDRQRDATGGADHDADRELAARVHESAMNV